jgi:glutamine amidotransferase
VFSSQQILATANYGGEFVVALRNDNILGVQFHAEKSHHYGSRLLKAFVDSGTL